VILVSRADTSALREGARAGAELSALGIGHQRLVVNGVLASRTPEPDDVAAAFDARQQHALAHMPEALRHLPVTHTPLVAHDLTGIAALRAFLAATHHPVSNDGQRAVPVRPAPTGFGTIETLIDTLAAAGSGVVMTMGKGGVGKTSLAAALARGLAARGQPVHLTTTDPAAHVSWAVGEDRPMELRVTRIDPIVETARYATEVLDAAEVSAAAEGGLTPGERALLEEDLRSPCTEEIAVFRAFARTVAEAAAGFVVLDTAPTGHTLLLLDAAESYHREVARTSGAQVPDAVRTLLPRLRDPQFTKMLLVTLAESTPVHEAARLQDELRRAGIEPFGWIVNASLAASGTTHPLLAARAALEARHLAQVRDVLATRAWLVPWLTRVAGEPGEGDGASAIRTVV
jgi:arsenite/tail-anchored protein-transporting ATPase